jgi:hypothetical protein
VCRWCRACWAWRSNPSLHEEGEGKVSAGGFTADIDPEPTVEVGFLLEIEPGDCLHSFPGTYNGLRQLQPEAIATGSDLPHFNGMWPQVDHPQ